MYRNSECVMEVPRKGDIDTHPPHRMLRGGRHRKNGGKKKLLLFRADIRIIVQVLSTDNVE